MKSIGSIGASEWEKLSPPDFPFADYAFLQALEQSGSVGAGTGWKPLYLTAREEEKIAGACFLYVKNDSYGEYIFDWAWANAYAQHGLPYYPKLISAVPFTPATGPKLLFSSGARRDETALRLIGAAKQVMTRLGASSLHYLYLPPDELTFFEREGFLIRHSFQYHWKNPGYSSFDGFLGALKPRKRKQIQRERRDLMSAGLSIQTLTGEDLKPEHAAFFHELYLTTIDKKEAIAYLTREFFEQAFRSMRDRIVLIIARESGTPIAGALFYEKGSGLYGRYWGAKREIRNLHFELCYYQPLEYAIRKSLKRFEAGAQGEHKFARGFLPELTYSAHWIAHPGFREAISRFVEEEKRVISTAFQEMRGHSPMLSEPSSG